MPGPQVQCYGFWQETSQSSGSWARVLFREGYGEDLYSDASCWHSGDKDQLGASACDLHTHKCSGDCPLDCPVS